MVFSICNCVLIKLVNYILIKDIIINYFNIYTLVKKDF